MAPMPLTAGDIAPDTNGFLTRAHPREGGHWTVLYFYPQGNNPHCVMQSRRYQALKSEFDRLGVQLHAVSVDTEEEQRSFRSLCALDFPITSDAGHHISRAYGVLETQEYEGRPVTYARRETFLIDPYGHIQHHWTNVDPNTNAAEVLEHVRSVHS